MIVRTTDSRIANTGDEMTAEEFDAAVRRVYGEDAVVEEFPDRWLAWASEADAENDSGVNAVASLAK